MFTSIKEFMVYSYTFIGANVIISILSVHKFLQDIKINRLARMPVNYHNLQQCL